MGSNDKKLKYYDARVVRSKRKVKWKIIGTEGWNKKGIPTKTSKPSKKMVKGTTVQVS